MQELPFDVHVGIRVTVRDDEWLIADVEPFAETTIVTLSGCSASNRGETRRILTPFDELRVAAISTHPRARSRRRVKAAVAAALADSPPWDECWTAARARIDLRAWQMEPARAAVAGTPRMLLADPVGLGKTIQASLLIAELMARGLADRAFVMTPASVTQQWADEMVDRFDLPVRLFDHSSLTGATSALPVGVNPWLGPGVVVSSIDLVKRSEVRSAIEEVPIDILVVDEAHHLTPGSDRAALVADLAARSAWVVLVTATPHSGDEEAHRFLLRLGAHGDDAPRVFRRRPPPVLADGGRRSRLTAVRPTSAERALLDATSAYVNAMRHSGRRSPGLLLVAGLIARRAASSAAAAHQTLKRRAALLSRVVLPAAQTALPWDEGMSDGDVDDALLARPGLNDEIAELDTLNALIGLADAAAGRSSKIDLLRRLLRRTSESILLFSEFRDVVVNAHAGICDIASVLMLHGGMSATERRHAVLAFNRGAARVLVATDAAGEGLNLHSHCRLVINLELPWNPLRLEQRIGRVDRLGQTRRVHAMQLVHRGSFEETVIARLQRRQRLAALREETLSSHDVRAHADLERALRRAMPREAQHKGPVFFAGSRRPATAVLAYAVVFFDRSGHLLQRDIVALRVTWCRPFARVTRQTCRALAEDDRILRAVHDELARRHAVLQQAMAQHARGVLRRSAAIIGELESRAGRQVWQASLFERRVEQEAQTRRAALTALTQHARRRHHASLARQTISMAEPYLIALWMEG